MYGILSKEILNGEVTRMDIYAPLVAAKARPGQFVIIRTHELGERLPLTIAAACPETGAVTIIYQKVGHSTRELDSLPQGGELLDFAGPLGRPTEFDGIKRAAVVGGGLGCAIAWPVARGLHARGAHVDMIAGFRTKELVILESELTRDSTALHVCTDDGSYGIKGFVTDALRGLLDGGAAYDHVFAIGPLPMMKFVSKLTLEYGLPTTVSMNPLMVDGTGMCGCCRVTVGGKIRFACVDGPDFDGHHVDFDEAMRRVQTYKHIEAKQTGNHICRMTGEAR